MNNQSRSDWDGFWRGYLRVLAEEGIPEKRRPHYTRWMQMLLAEIPLEALGKEQVEEFLHRLGRNPDVNGWQARQAVDAVRLGLCQAGRVRCGAWAGSIDWKGWEGRFRTLQDEHPTRMRAAVRAPEWAGLEEQWKKPHPDEARAVAWIERTLRGVLRCNDYALRTEQGYVAWAVRYARFAYRVLGGPEEVRKAESVGRYLHFLAVVRDVSPGTQKQALNALSFFFKKCLGMEQVDFGEFVRARERRRLPVVLSSREVARVLGGLSDPWRLAAELMYGSGLRVSESMRLRVKDLDFDRGQIVLRETKGGKGAGGSAAGQCETPVA